MKSKALLLSVSPLLLGFLFGCGGGEPSWTTYRDPSGVFSVKIPAAWKVTRKGGATVFKRSPQAATSLALTRVPKKDNRLVRTREVVLEGLAEQLELLSSARRSRPRSRPTGTRLAGRSALKQSVSFGHDGRRYKKDIYLIEGKQAFVVVDCSGAAGAFPSDVFNGVLGSLEIKP